MAFFALCEYKLYDYFHRVDYTWLLPKKKKKNGRRIYQLRFSPIRNHRNRQHNNRKQGFVALGFFLLNSRAWLLHATAVLFQLYTGTAATVGTAKPISVSKWCCHSNNNFHKPSSLIIAWQASLMICFKLSFLLLVYFKSEHGSICVVGSWTQPDAWYCMGYSQNTRLSLS